MHQSQEPHRDSPSPQTPPPAQHTHPGPDQDQDQDQDQGPGQDQGDPDILKSPNDPKTYRYLELSNGLRVLLISDCNLSSSGPGGRPEEASGEWEEASGEREGEEDGQPQKNLDRQAAAGLCVAVGSFSDPDDLPGLAHFLEHMVFMGSERFPEENSFDCFLKEHGGDSNAFTDCERTVFHFHIHRDVFRDTLDRWAQFFVCPLMVEEVMEREVEVVDSEFQVSRPSDAERRDALIGTIARTGHPMGKFLWGNAQTLKQEPREKGINTHERLRQFWRRYYTAQYMTLTVQSTESLDTLEQWIREIFIHIPNNGEAPVDFSHLQEPFNTPHFNKLYRVVPVKKVHALTINWALPPQQQHYRVKPLFFLSWLIEHEGTGSILSLLRKKCWALTLFAGNDGSGFQQNSTFSIFSVSITLTEQGHAHFYQVAHVVFQYLKMLQTLGPQQRIYEEIQKIQESEFQYQEQEDPVDLVASVCQNMQLFPKQHFLTGDALLLHYNPEVIGAALSLLSPLGANFMLLSPEHQAQCELTEDRFGTSYTIQDVPQEWRDLWSTDFELNPDLHLPPPNDYITSDFSLSCADCPGSLFPVCVERSQRGALWYKRDTTYNLPKAHIRFHLISPVVQRSPETLVLFDLLVNIVTFNLSECAYGARLALLSYSLVAAEHGMVIQLEGFNHKLPVLWRSIVDHLRDFSSDSCVFEVFSEQLKKAYSNQLLNPQRLSTEVRLRILEPSRWSVLHKHQVLVQGLDLDRLLDFVSEFKQQLYVEGLVQGNLTCQESKELLHYILQALQFRPLPAEVSVDFRVVELPQKHHICKVKSFNEEDATSNVTVYYQAGVCSLREHTLMELLMVHMEEPCFDFLRTKETLGYQVYPLYRNTSGVLGFSVTVQTQATKFSSEWVEERVQCFLSSFGRRLSSLSADAFRTQLQALVQQKKKHDSSLREEVERNWNEVTTQQYFYHRVLRQVEVLLSLSQEDLVSWFNELQENNRKLSVHVVGFGEQEEQEECECVESSAGGAVAVASSHDETKELHFLSASSPWLQQATPICDISAFNAALPLHPPPQSTAIKVLLHPPHTPV